MIQIITAMYALGAVLTGFTALHTRQRRGPASTIEIAVGVALSALLWPLYWGIAAALRFTSR